DSYPKASILGCSTAGEIYGTEVCDNSLVAIAVEFEHSQIKFVRAKLAQVENSFQAGECLAQALPPSIPSTQPGSSESLVHVIVLSDGLTVNGSELVRGLTKHLPADTTLTGGLAGDGER